MAVFLRVLDADPEAKGAALSATLQSWRSRSAEPDGAFVRDGSAFGTIPGSPLAYWVSDEIVRIFDTYPPLEGNAGTVRVGLQTSDDYRFVRAWWEVDPARIGYSREDSEVGRGWIHFAKGGSYSPYYADVHLVVNWFGNGAEIRNFDRAYIRNEDYYFRPGLTWPLRSQKGLSVRAFPKGSTFGHKGPVIFPSQSDRLPNLLAVANSQVFQYLVEAQMAFGSYEVGVLQRTPLPGQLDAAVRPTDANRAHTVARLLKRGSENSHQFRSTKLGEGVTGGSNLAELARTTTQLDSEKSSELLDLKRSLEGQVSMAYGLNRAADIGRSDNLGMHGLAVSEEDEDDEVDLDAESLSEGVGNLLQWCLGVAFGRWDIRMARDESLIPVLQGPFERLPRVAPAGLVGPDGLPATEGRIASEAWLRARPDVITLPEPGSWEGPAHITAAEYPIEVAWDGILVDEPGHERDIVRKVREVLRWVYGPDRARALEDEALAILRGERRTPRRLRDWFRNQKATELGKSFFDFHIARYSKSRRKAPIYWRLCTSPGRGQSGYGVWLYYPRLTGETLWTVLHQYVGPKVEREEGRLAELRAKRAGAEGSEAQALGKELEEAQDLLEELRWFEGELRTVAESGKYEPDLDDGVVINMAPLRAVVPWKEPEKVWEKLKAREYDWAKLAMRYWPVWVREKCRDDRSLAIAHGVDEGGA